MLEFLMFQVSIRSLSGVEGNTIMVFLSVLFKARPDKLRQQY